MGPKGIDEVAIDSEVGGSSLARSRVEGERQGGLVGDTIRLVALKEEHWEEVYRLYSEVFGSRLADAFAARRRWAQQQIPATEATPGWALLDGESVVGFLTTVPMKYLVDGVAVVAHTPADYMVHPKYRFHGIKLMQEFFRSCDNCVTCDDMRPTVRVIEWLGGKRAGALFRYVKILDGRVMRQRGRWALVPPVLWWPMTLALRAADQVRTRRLESGPAVQAQSDFDERFFRFSQKLSRGVPAIPVRDREFFEWRYGEASPQAGRKIGVVTGADGELSGYVIFFFPGGPKRTGYILDLQVIPPGDTRVARALMGYAVQQLRRSGAWMVRYHLLASPFALSGEVLADLGFVRRGGHYFLVKFRDEQLAATAERQGNWNYSFGDSEASHALE